MIRSAFFIVLTGIGIAIFYRGCCLLEQSREALQWPQAKGYVISSLLTIDHLPKFIDPRDDPARWYGAQVRYQYSVGDEEYISDRLAFQKGDSLDPKDALKVMNAYRRQHEVTVYYDPHDPGQAVLQPGYIGDIYIQFIVGAMVTLWGLYSFYTQPLRYSRGTGGFFDQGRIYQDQGKFEEAILEYNRAIKVNSSLALGYISRGNLHLQQKGIFEKLKFFEAGSAILSELIKKGVLMNVPLSEAPFGSFEFQAGEFGESLDKIKPLLLKLSQPVSIDELKDITSAVGWLNGSIKPFQIYATYVKINGISEDMLDLVPEAWGTLTDDELTELAFTVKGRKFKREILDFLYPQESPAKLRLNPDSDLKEDTVREIAKGDFNKIWSVLMQSQESWDLAIADFNQAIEIDPGNAAVYFSLANAYSGKKQYDKAWVNMQKAIDMGFKISPEIWEDMKKRGSLY
jgi:tetratricopeptide (TPR) repeat protein